MKILKLENGKFEIWKMGNEHLGNGKWKFGNWKWKFGNAWEIQWMEMQLNWDSTTQNVRKSPEIAETRVISSAFQSHFISLSPV